MSWDSNVTVTVVSGSQPVDRAVLNIPLHASDSPTFPERVRTYGSAAEGSADTLLGTEATAAVAAHFAQELHAPTIKIGRLGDTPAAMVVTWTVGGTPIEGEVYTLTTNGIVTAIVAGAAPTVTTVHVALSAAETAALTDEEITVSGVDPDIILTADNLGEPFSYSGSVAAAPGETAATGTLVAVLTVANAGIGSDLDAILADDSGWYGLTTEIHATPASNLIRMNAASAWTQINGERIYIAQSIDATVLTAGAGNDLAVLALKNNSRTAYIWHHDIDELAAVAWMSYTFWADPDERTTFWAYKPLSGISLKPTRLTSTEQGNITSQYGNAFAAFGGVAVTGMGITTTNRKIDLITTADWLEARLAETYTQLLLDVSARDDKIGIFDKELQVIPSNGQKILDQGVRVKHLVPGSTFISVPLRADMPAADITGRHIRVTAGGTAAGAAEVITVIMTLLVV